MKDDDDYNNNDNDVHVISMLVACVTDAIAEWSDKMFVVQNYNEVC